MPLIMEIKELTYSEINLFLKNEFEFSLYSPKRISEEKSYFRFKLKDTNLTFQLECYHSEDEDDEFHLMAFINANINGSFRGEFERIIEIINKYEKKYNTQ